MITTCNHFLIYKHSTSVMKILMVCLGNICRSPLAEGILKHKIKENHLDVVVDSCGFESYHIGCEPDYRSIEVAKSYSIDISNQKARLFDETFFKIYDKILVMDKNNYRMVADRASMPDDLNKVDFIMNVVSPGRDQEIPDPYYGRKQDFVNTFKLLDEATDRIVELIKTKQWQ